MVKCRWLLVLGFLAAAAGPAAAQDDRGLYVGGSGGYVLYDHSCDFLTVPCDDDDVGFRVFSGYRFNRHISLELGYGNLGEARAEGSLGGLPASRTIKIRHALDVSGLLSFGITTRLDGFVRLGLYHARMTVDDEVQFDPSQNQHSADTNAGWTVGAGLQYNMGFLGLRAEWQTYGDVGPSGPLQDNIHVFSLGALLRF